MPSRSQTSPGRLWVCGGIGTDRGFRASARAKSSGRYRSSPLSKALQGAALRGSLARGARSGVPPRAAAPRPLFQRGDGQDTAAFWRRIFWLKPLKTMAQLAAPPAPALRPHTPPPIAAPVNIRPGEKTRGVFGSWSDASSSSGTRSSPPINVPQHDDDEDEAAAVSQQDSLYEYRRYLFWLRLRRGGIAGNDYEAENGDPPPRRSRSPPLSSSYRRALSKPPEELFAFDL